MEAKIETYWCLLFPVKFDGLLNIFLYFLGKERIKTNRGCLNRQKMILIYSLFSIDQPFITNDVLPFCHNSCARKTSISATSVTSFGQNHPFWQSKWTNWPLAYQLMNGRC